MVEFGAQKAEYKRFFNYPESGVRERELRKLRERNSHFFLAPRVLMRKRSKTDR